ncbi:MAG: LysR family transcriptional regulator [Clostridia bacterium]|nr:LysR family transcriptional regulator [Clostridia bacterium]
MFVTLCDNDYFVTKTAEQLGVTQPSISNAIKELEKYYGVKLFDRIGRRLRITSAGLKLLEYSRLVVQRYNDLEREFRNWDRLGELRIGTSNSIGAYFLPSILSEFKKLYPDLTVKVTVNESSNIEELIINNEVDLALIEGVVHYEDINKELFLTDEISIIASPERYRDGQVLTREQFEKEDLMVREKGSGTREIFLNKLSDADIHPKITVESVSTEVLLRCTYANLGIAVVPRRVALGAYKEGRVVFLNLEDLNLKRDYLIIHHKDKFMSSYAEDFINVCKDVARAQ